MQNGFDEWLNKSMWFIRVINYVLNSLDFKKQITKVI